MLKHGTKFLILATTSCVKGVLLSIDATHFVVQSPYELSQYAAINAKSEICTSDCSINISDQKHMTHKCLDTRCAVLRV